MTSGLLKHALLTLFVAWAWSSRFEEATGDFCADAFNIFKWLCDIRRNLHRHPELGFEEYRTSALIQKELRHLNVSYTSGWGHITRDAQQMGGTGIVAEIGTGEAPCVVLRADIDALPIQELTDVSFKSEEPHKMHACGHDAHTAMLLGAARLLKGQESRLEGTVRFVFQPSEERDAGALAVLNDGLLDLQPKASEFWATHVAPQADVGTIVSRAGAILAGNYAFEWTHDRADAALVDLLLALRVMRHAQFDSDISSLISITSAHTDTNGGTRLMGTFRALDDNQLLKIHSALAAAAAEIGGNIKINELFYPTTMNDRHLFQWLLQTNFSNGTCGLTVEEAPPTLGSEDFSFYGKIAKVPSLFFFIGTRKNGSLPVTDLPLHHDRFAIDEEALARGSAFMAFIAERRLATLSHL